MKDRRIVCVIAALTCALLVSSTASPQAVKIQVLDPDSLPIPFAWIALDEAEPIVTGEDGKAAITNARHGSVMVEVRRIGYTPFRGAVMFPDTAAAISISLARVAQQLGTVMIASSRELPPLGRTGFYERALMRQKGLLSATFIGPEEMERRHPTHITDMLFGRLGISLREMPDGKLVARGGGGTCFMTILLDGRRLCPPAGCSEVPSGQFSSMTRPSQDPATQTAANDAVVDLNQYIDPNDIAAIEIYPRGGNMPVSLQTVDNACGVIAFWSGARR